LGAGNGVLLDIHGESGRVSMSVTLVPFPGKAKPEAASGPAPASNWRPKRRDFRLHPFQAGELDTG
jgi:hypothetical protein